MEGIGAVNTNPHFIYKVAKKGQGIFPVLFSGSLSNNVGKE
ncbi:hypothetical protein FM115_02205 [Marinilactibacillus psychrotolerans 42ea]|uniref:Uncharacterized protein n=1 Tax=Marinilactibacillus psychrotolerans 42ea TaxID=1255609 RepID=A0A1R4ISM5_9LACT|nr:hypothetical protein FM115_02205 [Marinilactibacillus psychrotolerans 42ea]